MSKHHRLGVQEWYALELKQCVVQRMRHKISDPFRNHDCNHDRKKELNIVRNFNLEE